MNSAKLNLIKSSDKQKSLQSRFKGTESCGRPLQFVPDIVKPRNYTASPYLVLIPGTDSRPVPGLSGLFTMKLHFGPKTFNS